MKDYIRLALCGIVCVTVVSVVLIWSASHDKQVLSKADQYEQCVFKAYGTYPWTYYQQHGEYPPCR